MFYVRWSLFRVCLLLPTALPATVLAEEWTFVWSDEFEHVGMPDGTKWSYEQGFVRNREAQYYTQARRENAHVEDGVLVVAARKEKYENPEYHTTQDASWRRSRPFAQYTSASLTTRGKASWKYGRIEVRAKLPQGRGMWPAIWTLGDRITQVGWPTCGEIDIMEYVGFQPHTIHANVHTKKYNHVLKTNKGASIEVPRPYEDFHVFAIQWDAKQIDFFVDQQNYFTFANEGTGPAAWPFDEKQYLILNIAVGGSWGGREGIDDSIFPQKMEVDYVRVYQKKAN